VLSPAVTEHDDRSASEPRAHLATSTHARGPLARAGQSEMPVLSRFFGFLGRKTTTVIRDTKTEARVFELRENVDSPGLGVFDRIHNRFATNAECGVFDAVIEASPFATCRDGRASPLVVAASSVPSTDSAS
jgi:hypothetical protein